MNKKNGPLHDLEEVYHSLFSKSTEALLVINNSYQIKFANPAAENLLGYNANEIESANVNNIVSGQSLDQVKAACDEAFGAKAQSAKKHEVIFISKNKNKFPAEFSIYNHIHSEFGPLAVILFNDISERKSMEENLRMSEERNRLLIEHTPAAVAMFDKNMRYIAVSRRWLSDYGLTEKNVIGMSHYDVFPEVPDKWKALHKRALAGEHLGPKEGSFTRQDGSVTWVNWELCPWFTGGGKIGGVILFTEVITERKLAEDAALKHNEWLEKKVYERTLELTEALEREKDINEMKSRFVSMASHEFRTPLSTLLSSIDLLEKYYHPQEGGKESKHFKKIKASVDQLTAILNHFLAFDKLENGAFKPQPSEFNFKELVTGIIEEMKGILKKGQKMLFSYSGTELMFQDPRILHSMLYNLLSNATKFSGENKKIELDIQAGDESVRIEVRDEGIGISEGEQKHMFSKLFRARNAFHIPGTGLGLNIVKLYVEMMGGDIRFMSRLGEGSVFTIDIPLRAKVQ